MNATMTAAEADPKHRGKKIEKSKGREYIEAFFTAVFIALFLRSFVAEPFKIPSSSMVPTLMVGDHIFVNKFSYGLRIPFTHKWFFKFKGPQRGDTIVFITPDPLFLGEDYIKRVVGLPGDRVRLDGDDVYVNGEKLQNAEVSVLGPDPQKPLQIDLQAPENFADADKFKTVPIFSDWNYYRLYIEKIGIHTHLKQEAPQHYESKREIVVPEGKLFVMGDNRDNSRDSRFWGFVPIENVKGKAMFVWLSLRYREDNPSLGWMGWDGVHAKGLAGLKDINEGFRWNRFGKWIP